MPQMYTRVSDADTNMEQCIPCVMAAQRYVGVPGLYGLRGLGAEPLKADYNVARDITSAGVALATTVLYMKKAPKKWKRPNKLGAVAAVVGLYFLTSFVYGRVVV